MTSRSVCSLLLAATFAAAFAGASFAETPRHAARSNEGCPVQLSQLRIHDHKLIFRDTNSSDHYIKKIVVGAAYVDSENVAHRIDVEGGWKDLHVGFALDSALDIKHYRNADSRSWVIWPEKVLFSDGTLWQIDQDSASCGLENRNANKQDASTVSVPAAALSAQPVMGEN